MLRRPALLRSSSAAATQTLTAWLAQLAQQAEALPQQLPNAALLSSSLTSSAATSTAPAQQLFRDIEDAATHANALRETDTLFTILHCAFKKNHFPADVDAWARLAAQLLPYGGIEAGSVLHYLGRPAAAVGAPTRGDGKVTYNNSNNEETDWSTLSTHSTSLTSATFSSSHTIPHGTYHLPITRETLLMTGGVVPLSARLPCGDGRMIAIFLDNFSQFVRLCAQNTNSSSNADARGADSNSAPQSHTDLSADVLKAVRSVSKSVLQALKTNSATLQWELLLPSLLNYLRLLHELDLHSSVSALKSLNGADAKVSENEAAAVMEEDGDDTADREGATTTRHQQQTRFLPRLMNGLSHQDLDHGAHGARVALYYLNDCFARAVEQFQSSEIVSQLSKEDAQRLYWLEQQYFIALTRSCMRAIYLHYTPDSTAPARAARRLSPAADLVLAAPMNGKIEALYDQVDVVFQKNTNAGNPLHMNESAVAQLKDIHTLALLRALRMEVVAPDTYLRRALEVVDRVPASMAIEGELIAGKVRLLDLDGDTVDEDGRTAVYNDLLTSLRSLVEMRPRFTRQDGAGRPVAGPDAPAAEGEESTDEWRRRSFRDGSGTSETEEGEYSSDDDGSFSIRVDAVTQEILQRAHADVITAFCAAHKEEWANEAYNILVTHKYHGVKITKELILPMLEVFSRRGDCRAFNLVDLCVLYSNEPVDMKTIALLFRTCATAGDHYRARTFLQLLNEIIPGFLAKCPASVRESLQELKLLDPPPRHLFVSTEDDLVQSALGEEKGAVRHLPEVG